MTHEFHPEAEQELIEAALLYEAEIEGLGQQLVEEVALAVSLLIEHPEIGVSVDSVLRGFVLRRFPYTIMYARVRSVLFVVAVAHERRQPGYWKLRVQDSGRDA